MKKKVLIGVGSLVVLLIAGFLYLNNRNRTLSPPKEAALEWQSGGSFKVKYSAPSVRDRVIFGTEEEGAIQPYGKYWRLGANESTEIEFTKDLKVNGNALAAGKYKVYCYPAKDEFTFCFAPADGAWGYSEPDKADELFRVQIPVDHSAVPVEQFVISLQEAEGTTLMICHFADFELTVPFTM